MPERKQFYEFGVFQLAPAERLLLREGKPVPLSPKAFETLLLLVENSGHLLKKDEIMRCVWPDAFVEEVNLAHHVSAIRRALDGKGGGEQYIETVPKGGYRFIAETRRVSSEAAPVLTTATEQAAPVAPEPRKKPATRIALTAAATVLAIGVVLLFVWRSRLTRASGTAPLSPAQIRSIAVLPLVNLSSDPQQEYFSDGMTDELITHLAKFGGLRVISHTSVERYKQTKRPLREIARELGVDAVVEGRVLRSGDRVRITAQLIDARSDTHLWADSYERDLRDVLGLQGEVAKQIASEIGINLTAVEQTRLAAAQRKVNPAAHEAYLKGAFYWKRLTCSGFETALKYFREVTTKDPSFAPAYSGLANTYFELADWRCWPQATLEKVEPAARQALERDPGFGEAHAALGRLAFSHEWNWTKAGQEFGEAVRLDPNNADTLSDFAIYLISTGKQEDGLAEMRKAQEFDPISENSNLTHVYALYLTHQYDQAIAQAILALNLFPNSAGISYWLGQCYEKKGMPEEAIGFYLKATSSQPEEAARRRAAYEKEGLLGFWEEDRQSRKRSKREIDPVIDAMYSARRGEKGKAINQLLIAYQQHCDGLQFLRVEPAYENLRDDPRFQALLRRLKFPG